VLAGQSAFHLGGPGTIPAGEYEGRV